MVYYYGMYRPTNYLAHHGILGMKWGKQNGPPYPLGSSDHSASEKKAGWRKSLDGSHKRSDNVKVKRASSKTADKNKENNSKSSTSHKARNVALTVAALAVIGGTSYYLIKSGKAGDLVEKGRQLAGDVIESSSIPKKLKKPESISDTLRLGNLLRNSPDGKNNCVPSSITGFLRQRGYDVTAKGTGGVQINPGGALEECFKGVKVKDASARVFGKSPTDAAKMLIKQYGNDAEGIVNITWKNGFGHAFNFRIREGRVLFYDTKLGTKGSQLFNYWGNIDTNGALTFARLDGLDINWEAVQKYCNFA